MTVRRDEARDALLAAAERLDLPLTVRQVDELVVAVVPFLARVPPPPRRVPGRVERSPVPAGPTVAAVEGLLAEGWPLSWQAQEAGMNHSELSRVLRRATVYRRTEEKVLGMAGRLRGRDPVECGVAPRVVVRARNEAARRRAALAAGEAA